MKKSQKNDTPSSAKEYRERLLEKWAKEANAQEYYKQYVRFDKRMKYKRIAIIVMSVMMAIMMILTFFFPALVWFVWMFIVFTLFETLDMRIDQLWSLRMVDDILEKYNIKEMKEMFNGELNH